MQVELLRDLYNRALHEPNESIRVGCFWCHVPDYEEFLSSLQQIYSDDSVESLSYDNTKIQRINNGFDITDKYGHKDFYSRNETLFLINLWNKTKEVEVNTVYLVNDENK